MIEKKQILISRACSTLELSRSNYYDWKKRKKSIDKDIDLRNEIQGIALEFPFYGYRRITKELHRRKIFMNHKKVLRIMKRDNLLCLRKKLFRPVTTQSDHSYKVYPNLAKNLKITGLNQLWVADITYIRLPKEFVYLSVIIDRFSRKCIGWALRRNIDTSLTLSALQIAMLKRKKFGFKDLVHHSDRGMQYASDLYISELNNYKIKISMSKGGCPYDNAYAETFMKTLKIEEVYIKEYETYEEAYSNIKNFIELVYNKKRLHSSIGYVPPEEFEMEVLSNKRRL